ncbi:queuosine precursor transporter [Methanogenium cariaci]|uniref:queuosine precursor transporter n=1 Tax=Methanogenium cariaci TaxID=2197 RepID=UPI001FDED3A8|nr:queuosine precursor transporter [Methanogenium cariaci]
MVEIAGIVVAVGIISYPITFLVTDIIADVHGKRLSSALVAAGVAALVFTLLLTVLSVALPAADRYPFGESYTEVFGSSVRIIIASIISFAISQTHDVWAFHMLKEKTGGKHLWLRNNVSTVFSQLADTTLFMFIAFYGAAPMYTAGFIVSLIIPYWLLKVGVALCDTPFCYLGVRWLRSEKKPHPKE